MPCKVLVVDDERQIGWSLEQTLTCAGYEVETAESAATAMAAFRAEPADIVVLDLKLPDADGFHVLRQVKQAQPDTQIVIMTAYADVRTAVEAMRLGAYDYLPKPIDFEALAVTLRNALERFGREFRKSSPRLTAEAERLLMQYDWPGNVRELRNVIERGMILAESGELLPADLPPELSSCPLPTGSGRPLFVLPKGRLVMEGVERDLVRQALEAPHCNQTHAARLLGLTRDELRYRVRKFELGHKTEGASD